MEFQRSFEHAAQSTNPPGFHHGRQPWPRNPKQHQGAAAQFDMSSDRSRSERGGDRGGQPDQQDKENQDDGGADKPPAEKKGRQEDGSGGNVQVS